MAQSPCTGRTVKDVAAHLLQPFGRAPSHGTFCADSPGRPVAFDPLAGDGVARFA
ncbi:hypothetical protein [Antrihabitans stalactiti]|uniref:hypothetical protein n=1 Tax=Antrihabitans stalactiti TaxID=2584121 RepID=UPI00146B116C|nr:hypothetical protein [Antrihabitans stalactiti]